MLTDLQYVRQLRILIHFLGRLSCCLRNLKFEDRRVAARSSCLRLLLLRLRVVLLLAIEQVQGPVKLSDR